MTYANTPVVHSGEMPRRGEHDYNLPPYAIPSGYGIPIADAATGLFSDQLPFDLEASQALRVAWWYPDYMSDPHPSSERPPDVWAQVGPFGICFRRQSAGQLIDDHNPSSLYQGNFGSTSNTPFIFASNDQQIQSGYEDHPQATIQNDPETQPPYSPNSHPQEASHAAPPGPDSFLPFQFGGNAGASSARTHAFAYATDELNNQPHNSVRGSNRRPGAMQMQMRNDLAPPSFQTILSGYHPQDDGQDETDMALYQFF